MVQQGHHQQGLTLIEEGIALRRATGGLVGQPWECCMQATALMEMERFEEGLTSLTEAMEVANDHEDRLFEAEVYRLNGDLLRRRNDSDTAPAQSCFERAIEIARNQAAKLFELRATTGPRPAARITRAP